jgi:hypothetical protein
MAGIIAGMLPIDGWEWTGHLVYMNGVDELDGVLTPNLAPIAQMFSL